MKKKNKTILGIIGGSGLYNIDDLKSKSWKKIKSSFGQPSDEVLYANLSGLELRFLPRHGRGHTIPPSEINYKANIEVLKKSGVTDLISISAVGSLREDYKPGDFVIIDQFIDKTFSREKTFFEKGFVAHVSMATPICKKLSKKIYSAASELKIKVHSKGTYLVMEGPQFSTIAESELYRSWKCDVIGMTNMPEAKLAREAEICYSSLAMVTDYDCWHPEHDNVSVESIINVLNTNSMNAKKTIKNIVSQNFYDNYKCSCKRALDNSIITSKEYQNKKVMAKLSSIIKRITNNGY